MASTADALFDLLRPRLVSPPPAAPAASAYLARLSSLPLLAIQTSEPAALASTEHSLNVALQSLASRSHRAIIASSAHHSTVSDSLSALSASLADLKSALPPLDKSITTFASTYARDSAPLQHRAQTALLSANLERLLDILTLPSLLQSLIASSSYPTALDLLSHVRRLRVLHPESTTVRSVADECETLQQQLCGNLIVTLRGPLKLPVAMKTVGYLRRATTSPSATTAVAAPDERALRAIFLVCRKAYFASLLDALAPLQELADEERQGDGSATGMQTERFLKRWIEIFREQSFGIISMYRSIFPASLSPSPSTPVPSRPASPGPSPSPVPPPSPFPRRPGAPQHSRSSSSMSASGGVDDENPEGGELPDPLNGFVPHLIDMLIEILRTYLSTIKEKTVKESLMTQVLYASGSLGRLGGEFAGIIGVVDGLFSDEGEEEWVGIVYRQKVLSSRLETLAGSGRP